jgi:glycosyltransferase involved in cell wall biosynthesis
MSDIVFVSEVAKDSFNQLFSIRQNIRQKVIYNPIDTVEIMRQSMEFDVIKNKFIVLGVGRLSEQKRFDRFIDVAKILSDKKLDMEFWILGMGMLEANLKEKVNQLNLKDSVVFKGFVDNPYPYIKSADVFLLTSDAEGYPTVVCESLVLGKPIVMTEVSGARELLGNSEYGIITKDMVPETIATEIEKLYLDKNLYHSYVMKSKMRSQIFQLDATMNEVYQLLNTMD